MLSRIGPRSWRNVVVATSARLLLPHICAAHFASGGAFKEASNKYKRFTKQYDEFQRMREEREKKRKEEPQKKTFYEIMGIDPKATPDEIKRKYHQLAKQYHPDFNTSSEAKDRLAEINSCYTVLRDPEKRRAYDLRLDNDMTADADEYTHEQSSRLRYSEEAHMFFMGDNALPFTYIRNPSLRHFLKHHRQNVLWGLVGLLCGTHVFRVWRKWRFLDDSIVEPPTPREATPQPPFKRGRLIVREELPTHKARCRFLMGFLGSVVGFSTFHLVRHHLAGRSLLPAIACNVVFASLVSRYLLSHALGNLDSVSRWNMLDFLHGNITLIHQTLFTLIALAETARDSSRDPISTCGTVLLAWFFGWFTAYAVTGRRRMAAVEEPDLLPPVRVRAITGPQQQQQQQWVIHNPAAQGGYVMVVPAPTAAASGAGGGVAVLPTTPMVASTPQDR